MPADGLNGLAHRSIAGTAAALRAAATARQSQRSASGRARASCRRARCGAVRLRLRAVARDDVVLDDPLELLGDRRRP